MTAIFSFPKNETDYTQVNIYKSDSVDGTYNNIDTVDVNQMEYEDESGDISNYYKVAFTDGQDESAQISVQTLAQKVVDIIRIELKIDSDNLSDTDIDFLVESCKEDVLSDLSTFRFNEQLEKSEEGIFKLPNRFYFDVNFGGAVSPLDIQLYKQEIPITVGSEKVSVDAIEINTDDQYVKVEPLSTSEILKIDYYSAGRKIKPKILNKVLAYKICANHYDTVYAQMMNGDNERVKVGDVSITKPVVKKANIAKDMHNKMSLRYKQYVQQLTRGFVKVK